MISVEKAKKLILKNTQALAPSIVDVIDSLGSILSENVISPVVLPPFDQSAMDGFAIKFSDHVQNKNIKVIGEVAAGKFFSKTIASGQAVRIFTGAPVPSDTDTVIMQEKVSIKNGDLSINDPGLFRGANVRMAGSQIGKGKKALAKGTVITPGGVGYLTAMGVTSVKTISAPRITIIVTGSELKKPGEILKKGQIHESNSYTLQAALRSIHLAAQKTVWVQDHEQKVIDAIKKAISNSDMVLITGGVSVGDYDFVGSSLEKLGVENIFYKVKQKPGKPLFFGKHNKTLIFGLPGNPAAVLTCFYEYVFMAIRAMQGRKETSLKKIILPIAKDHPKKKGLAFFLKGQQSGNSVNPLDGQQSYILSSFALADSIIFLPEEAENIKKGDSVEVHLLPHI
jgi:molybdopterin molybdotransferase